MTEEKTLRCVFSSIHSDFLLGTRKGEIKLINTLTSGFKPIQLPKLNTNLLSVISLIMLCAMVFVAVDAFASDCEDLENEVKKAQEVYNAAKKTFEDAQALVDYLKETGANQEAIDLAEATRKSAETTAVVALLNVIRIQGLLLICKLSCLGESDDDEPDDDEPDDDEPDDDEPDDDEPDSGSCDSGSCG